jgi:DNA-binding LytR/AlgR family response regulator
LHRLHDPRDLQGDRADANIDYVLKPVSDERLLRAIERLKQKLATDLQPEALSKVLRTLARALPPGNSHLRWLRALKGDEVHQSAVADVVSFQAQGQVHAHRPT